MFEGSVNMVQTVNSHENYFRAEFLHYLGLVMEYRQNFQNCDLPEIGDKFDMWSYMCNKITNCVTLVIFTIHQARLKTIVPGLTYTLQKTHKKKIKDTQRKQNKNTCQQFIIYTSGTFHITFIFYIFGTFHNSENMEKHNKNSKIRNP